MRINPYPSEHEYNRKKKYLLITLFITLLLMSIMILLDRMLTDCCSSVNKYGIVAYELAFNQLKANTIIESWGEKGKGLALFSLGLDFLYIAAYSTTLLFFALSFHSVFVINNPSSQKPARSSQVLLSLPPYLISLKIYSLL